nr:AzlC family ABC transporter permease [Geodermatophilaceae bacterium]
MRDSLGVGLAVGLYGAAFGAASTSAGLDVLQTCTLSLLMFTGASQFALVGVLGAGGSAVAAVASALLLGSRNALYGVRLSGPLGLLGARRVLAAHGVIDETTAMALAVPRPELVRVAFSVTGVTLFLGWNLSTLAGALGSQGLGDGAARAALDAVVPAAFLALLWPRLRAGAADRRV